MRNKKRFIIGGILLAAAAITLIFITSRKKTPAVITSAVYPRYGTIKTFVSTTGTIQPQNRLEIKPPINGRVERILVREGDRVRAGQTLILMSSTDRAALIDAARAQGSDQLKYWEEVYKPIPLVAPISGTVIVRAMEPGQTATTATAILVLSDRLIVKANVDETDIGRVREGQRAEISLDAYPDVRADGRVVLIKYESTVVNNVTTYAVDILPDRVPPVFKSGMSANISIFDKIKKNVLLLPADALIPENGGTYVLVGKEGDKKRQKRPVQTGLEDEQSVEIVSGLSVKDRVLVEQKKFVPADTSKSGNPFMPMRRRQR
jgi:macrolide-specific efflux system membrane fusion protein